MKIFLCYLLVLILIFFLYFMKLSNWFFFFLFEKLSYGNRFEGRGDVYVFLVFVFGDRCL